MKSLNRAVASLVLLGALAGSAFAQGEAVRSDFESTVLVYTPRGIIQKKITDKAMLDMMTKDATPMAPGSMMIMHNGKMYAVTDKKMPDGHMMSEMVMNK